MSLEADARPEVQSWQYSFAGSITLVFASGVGLCFGQPQLIPQARPRSGTGNQRATTTDAFFQSWFHTYLVKARRYKENDLLLSSLPFLVAAWANLSGGLLSNTLVKRIGLRWGRCGIGVVGLTISGLGAIAVMFTHHQIGAMVLLSLIYAGITFQQPMMFAVCLDVGGKYAGAMNTASQIGSFLSALVFGYIVDVYGSYDLPFVPMAALLLTGAWLWLKVDPAQPLITEEPAATRAIKERAVGI